MKMIPQKKKRILILRKVCCIQFGISSIHKSSKGLQKKMHEESFGCNCKEPTLEKAEDFITCTPTEQYIHITQKIIPRYGIRLGMRVKNVAIKALYCLTCIRILINRSSLARRRYRILK